MKLVGKLLAYPMLTVNAVISLLLIFSCYGSMAAPIGKWPFASLSGLAFPFLYVFNLLFLMLWLAVWKKGALMPFLTILICLPPTLRFFPVHFLSSTKVEEPYITVVTYNTEGFGFDDNKDNTLTNPVLSFITGLDADIVLLQEVRRDLLTKAKNNKDIKSRYPYIELIPGSTTEACLSKYPVILNQAIHFDESTNACQYLRLLAGKDTIAVYNCHLQSNMLKREEISEYYRFIEHPTDSAHYKGSKAVLKKLLESTSLRAGQAVLVADKVKGETARYVIVGGDFNDTPLSYSHHVFNRFMTDSFTRTGLGAGHTYHDHRLYYRIDHIFCSRNITPLYTWIDRIQKDSDHYPVISKIRLE